MAVKPRMILVQILLLIIILPLAYGPIGHYWNLNGGAPDLFLISVWAFTWLTNRSTALIWALVLGLSLDLLSFWPFGFWMALLVSLTFLIDYAKSRFFEVSSILEALFTLLIANILIIGVEYLLTRTFLLRATIISTLSNVLIGLVLYYLLVMRFHLTERWEGRRL